MDPIVLLNSVAAGVVLAMCILYGWGFGLLTGIFYADTRIRNWKTATDIRRRAARNYTKNEAGNCAYRGDSKC